MDEVEIYEVVVPPKPVAKVVVPKKRNKKLERHKRETKNTLRRGRIFRAKRPKVKVKGPAFAEWAKRLRPKRAAHQCNVIGCSTKPKFRNRYCTAHKAEYRKAQLAANNRTYIERKQQGKAGHRMLYAGKLTVWAKLNPMTARRVISDGQSSLDEETFNRLLET